MIVQSIAKNIYVVEFHSTHPKSFSCDNTFHLEIKELEPGTWIPLRVFVLRDISLTDRKRISIRFTAVQNRLKRLLIVRN